MPSRHRHARPLAAFGVLAVAAVLAIAGIDLGLALLLAPGVLLALPLIAGRYPGETRLARWRAVFTPRPRRGTARLAARLARVPGRPTPGARSAGAMPRRGPPRVALPS
jgi:hypothetical protein